MYGFKARRYVCEALTSTNKAMLRCVLTESGGGTHGHKLEDGILTLGGKVSGDSCESVVSKSSIDLRKSKNFSDQYTAER